MLADLVAAGQIRYLHQTNRGAAAARNAGAALAQGELICFLDDDDLLLPHALATLATGLLASPDRDVVFGSNVAFEGPPPESVERATAPPGRRGDVTFLDLFDGNPIVTPGQALMRRSAFVRCGGFAESIWGADDWDLWFHMARVKPLARLSTPVLLYRLHGSNASRNAPRLCRNMVRVIEHHLPSVPAADRSEVRSRSYRRILPWWRLQLTQSNLRSIRFVRPRHLVLASLTLSSIVVQSHAAGLRYRFHSATRRLLPVPRRA